MSARWSDTRALAGDVPPAACGFVLGSQVILWPLLSRPIASALVPDASALMAVLAILAASGLAAGRGRDAGATGVAPRLLTLAPLGGALLALVLGPWCRALELAGFAGEAGRVAAGIAILGPMALLTTRVMMSARSWAPFWWGAAAGCGAAILLAPAIPLWALLPGLSLAALLVHSGLRRADPNSPATPSASTTGGALAVLFAWTCPGLALFELLRLTLHLGGMQLRGRAGVLLAGLVTVAISVALTGRHPGRRPALAAGAMIAAALWSLLGLAASGALLPQLVIRMGGGVSLPGALGLALLLLAPAAAGVTVALAVREDQRADGAGLAALGLGIALILDELVLSRLLDPGRAWVLVVVVLALGAALQASLALPGRRAWAGSAVAVVLGAAALALPSPDLRVLAADLAWDPGAWSIGKRPAVPDRLGRRRVESIRRDGLGVASRVIIAGHPDRILWRGAPMLSLDPLEESARFTSGFIVGLLHPGPRSAIVGGLESGAVARGLRASAPGIVVVTRPLTPSVQAVQPPGLADAAGAPAPPGQHPDIILLAPPPAWLAGGSAGLAREDLTRTLRSLSPGGTLAVRLRPRDFGEREFEATLTAVIEACPASSLWYDGDALLIIAWVEAPRLDLAALEAHFRSATDRATAGLEQVTDVLAHFVLPAAGLSVLAAGTPADSIWRPLLALTPPPVGIHDGENLLARLASLPDDVLALFAQLDTRGLSDLRTRLEPAARANAHVMAAQGLTMTDPAAALGHVEQALELRPNDPLVRLRAARLLFSSALVEAGAGRGAESLARAERALALDPLTEDHGLLVFDLLGRAGREVQAGKALDALALRHPTSYPVQLLLAQRRLDQRDVNAGDLFLRRAAETGFETADLLVGFARVAFARGDAARGRQWVRRAVALGPDPAGVLAYAGGRLLADGQSDDAAVLLQESRDLGLESADVLGALGELALQRKDLPEACRLLQAAVDHAPGLPLLRAQLGSALLISGNPAAALPHLEKAVQQLPGDPLIRLNLAVALARAGRVEDARREVLSIGDRLPDNPVLERLREDLGLAGTAPAAPN